MIDILPVRIRQLLAELEMLPHGKVASLNPTVRGGERDPRPQGESKPPHDDLRRKYLRAYSDDERADIEQEMIRQLKEFKGIKKPKVDVTKKVSIDADMRSFAGWTPKEIARRTGNVFTVRQVMDWRKLNTLCVSTGYEQKPDKPRQQRVLELKQMGLSQSEIATSVEISRQAVSQILKKAA